MKSYDRILQELDKHLAFTPGFEGNGWFQVNGQTISADISQNLSIESPFTFNYIDQRILHFTSLDSAIKILGSKYIRASNLNSLNDKGELLHALELINSSSEVLYEIKKQSFVACFTPYPKDRKVSDLDFHWENYGNKKRGLAFEFEIIRTPLYPQYYSLSVNYLDKKEQSDLLTHLYNNPASNVNLKALSPIFASIKSSVFNDESEVRLFAIKEGFEFDIENMVGSRIGVMINDENIASYYLMLPFIFNNEQLDQYVVPLLRLKKIYFHREVETNDGQEYLLNYILPLCDKNGINYEWI